MRMRFGVTLPRPENHEKAALKSLVVGRKGIIIIQRW
jgi:hypothetical protein